MSETQVQKLREEIDDLLDKAEDAVDQFIEGTVPGILKGTASMFAKQGFGLIRGVLNIPDDIGGDED